MPASNLEALDSCFSVLGGVPQAPAVLHSALRGLWLPLEHLFPRAVQRELRDGS